MNDIASLTAQPVIIRVEVKDEQGQPTGEVLEYQVYPLKISDYGELQAWINRQFPDPFDSAWKAIEQARARERPFNVAQEQFLLKNAAELALRPEHKIGTTEATELLMSAEGTIQYLMVSIRKGDPEFSEADAQKLYDNMTPLDIIKAYMATQLNLVASDPKAPQIGEPLTPKPNGETTSPLPRADQTAPIGGTSTTGS